MMVNLNYYSSFGYIVHLHYATGESAVQAPLGGQFGGVAGCGAVPMAAGPREAATRLNSP